MKTIMNLIKRTFQYLEQKAITEEECYYAKRRAELRASLLRNARFRAGMEGEEASRPCFSYTEQAFRGSSPRRPT